MTYLMNAFEMNPQSSLLIKNKSLGIRGFCRLTFFRAE